jgi:hypothetical protein
MSEIKKILSILEESVLTELAASDPVVNLITYAVDAKRKQDENRKTFIRMVKDLVSNPAIANKINSLDNTFLYKLKNYPGDITYAKTIQILQQIK